MLNGGSNMSEVALQNVQNILLQYNTFAHNTFDRKNNQLRIAERVSGAVCVLECLSVLGLEGVNSL